jgi:colanic acid biosynthesis glycosyl transferase WcaI
MQVQRLWVYASGTKERMLNRLLSYLSFSALALVAGLVSRAKYDVILCSNGAFFTGLSAAIIGSIKHAPYIYNVQDLYPETPVHAGQLRNKLAIAVLEILEHFMYRTAAHISVIAPGFRTNILAKGVPSEAVSVIPNFVDTQFVRPLARSNAFSEAHGLDGKFVVTHAGNLGYVYDLETLLDAAALLKSDSDLVLLIVGDGVMRDRLRDKARALELPNVRFLPYQPRDVLPLLRATSDVQVALYARGSARYSMPSKVYEIMASARPVLASAESGSDLARLVTETRCGICVLPGDAHALAAAIRALRADPPLCRHMGERGRLAVESEYSRNAVVAQYDELVRAIRKPEPGRTERKDAWESLHLPRVS